MSTCPGLNKLSAYKPQVYQDIKIIQDNAREVTKSFAELCRYCCAQCSTIMALQCPSFALAELTNVTYFNIIVLD